MCRQFLPICDHFLLVFILRKFSFLARASTIAATSTEIRSIFRILSTYDCRPSQTRFCLSHWHDLPLDTFLPAAETYLADSDSGHFGL